MKFPSNFIWGVASAAYQIEGGITEGGRTPTIWDTFSHIPGKTFGGHTGDIACEHYHRWAEDIDLIAAGGLHHYRFSVGWSRILPDGDGEANSEGLAFYDKIVNRCLEKGITPYLTLYHWDLPQVLEDKGGWLSRDTVSAFARLAQVVGKHFCGRVKHYITINEPQCIASLGYESGIHAPGKSLSQSQLFEVMHNLALAHGAAAKVLRQIEPDAKVGVATTGRLCYPATEAPADLAAAKFATFALYDDDWVFTHHLFLDAICFGHYPRSTGTFLDRLILAVPGEDMEAVHQPPDFIGLNVYNGREVQAGGGGIPEYTPKYAGFPRTALKWPVTPEVLHYGVAFVWERYRLPIFITENGQSCNDHIFLDGKVHDADRIDFLHRYLQQLTLAIAEGADVRGYFHWGLTDNYEWHSGYDDRFGLIYIDYPTQRRIPKDSYYWYCATAAQNGESL
ncbi:GH1 family beta-glucosidase [Hydrogenoanaerobacterium sp.]|uniref:GH1 family beta-glucosidase n=1 Tax=Hydrogenoanaerobacterium sp. TaxID=2953763 RepID=UPI002899B84E|nr:GH1 family beta-glucosidase [Hydrogenoanaerobacterium sp.]